jgi:hypothetical protein
LGFNLVWSEVAMQRTLAVCLLFLSGVVAIADHLPAKLQARSKPENTLAGINLEHDDAAEVLKILGPPTKKVTVPNNPQWTGYLWDMGNVRLEVEVTRGKSKDYLGQLTVIRLGGGSSVATPATRETTGRGLKLGDTLDGLKSLYGSRFQLSKQANVPADTDPFLSVPGVQTVVVQWAAIEFTLTAGFDSQGRIIALRLSPPECYPGGCQ